MKQSKLTLLGLSLAAVGAIAFSAMRTASGQAVNPTVNVHQTPLRLVHAQPFELDQPSDFIMRSRAAGEAVSMQKGWILAIATDPEVAFQNQAHDELLFVGEFPLERVNNGNESGVVVGFVPEVDLATAPIYWAKPEILPESMTAEDARATLAAAVADGAAPQTASALDSANADTVYLRQHGELYGFVADLIAQHSPQETDLVESLRMEPLIK